MNVEINLTKIGHFSSLPEDEIIQVHALERLSMKVNRALHLAKESPSTRVSNVFFIDGTRGAGKTTFLKIAAKKLTRKDLNTPVFEKSSLAHLIEIDPSLIETGEHVFFTILFALRDIVIRFLDDKPELKKEKYEDWRRSLQRIAKGSNVLAHRTVTEFADDYLNLNEGLDRARSGLNLETEFHELINDAAEIVGAEAFLITFDDVDTEFKEGWRILELIRRYLQTSRLIVLITGDLQLYTHLVRSRQFENFGQILHVQDSARIHERSQLVDHLEQQYLLKLFPLPNRIELLPLSRLVYASSNNDEKSKTKYFVRYLSSSNRSRTHCVSLEDMTLDVVKQGFSVVDSRNAKMYQEYLLSLPVRAVVQILRVYCEADRGSEKAEVISRSLRGTLLGSLYQAGVDVDALTYHNQSKLIEAVFDVVRKDGEFDTGSYLRPQPSNETLRNAFVSLAAEVASQCYGKPDRAIRYMLQAPGSLALAHLNTPQKIDEIDNFFAVFKKEFSIGRNEDSLNWARYAAPALLNPFRDSEGVGPGVIKLSGKRARSAGVGMLDIPDIQIVSFHVIKHYVMAKSSRTYLSIFNLLGVMERLLILTGSDTSVLERDVRALLLKLTNTVTISPPSWMSGRTDIEESNRDDDAEMRAEGVDTHAIDQVSPLLARWVIDCKSHAKRFAPSSLMLGKIWTRLYFSLSRAQGSIRKRGYGAGSAMHLYVMCLINACLVEELDYGTTSEKVNEEISISRSNPLYSTTPVLRKILKLEASEKPLPELLPFTAIILSCPLIEAFLPVPEEMVTTIASRKLIPPTFAERDVEYRAMAQGLETLNSERIMGVRRNEA